jgi:hypothetical protein
VRDVNRDWLADRHGERFNEVRLYMFQFWLKSNRDSRIVCLRKSSPMGTLWRNVNQVPGSLSKLRKTTISFVTSVRIEKLGYHYSYEILYLSFFFENLSRKSKFHLNLSRKFKFHLNLSRKFKFHLNLSRKSKFHLNLSRKSKFHLNLSRKSKFHLNLSRKSKFP